MLSVALNVVIVVILLWTVCVGCGDQSVVTLSTSLCLHRCFKQRTELFLALLHKNFRSYSQVLQHY